MPDLHAAVGAIAATPCAARTELISEFLTAHGDTLTALTGRLSYRLEGPRAETVALAHLIVTCAAVKLLCSAQPGSPETDMFLHLLDTTARHDLRVLVPPKPRVDRHALAALALSPWPPHTATA